MRLSSKIGFSQLLTGLMVLFALLHTPGRLRAATYIVPPAAATVDAGANSGAGDLFHPIRIQTVYPSSMFTNGPMLIQELRYRPSASYGQAFTSTLASIEINLSTSTGSSEPPSGTFAANRGIDNVLVWSGNITLSSRFTNGPGNTKSFDIIFPLTTPFYYDPAAGHLVVDLRHPLGDSATYLDVTGAVDGAGRVFSTNPDATSGPTDTGADVLQIVYSPPSAPPIITSQPQSQGALVGANASFSVTASGSSPLFYQWSFNGGPIATATNALLSLSNLTLLQSGNYRVAVSNVFGSTNSSIATLTVTTAPPTILTQPVGATVPIGTNFTFSVVAGGALPLFYQWSFNGTPLSGQTNASLSLSNTSLAQAGNYRVAVSNAFGSTNSSIATLIVTTSPPTILTQPFGAAVLSGTNYTFSVTAGGSPPLFYQWSFNGTPLADQTNTSLSLSNISLAQAGGYSVMVSNAYGVTSSGVATLSVYEILGIPVVMEPPGPCTRRGPLVFSEIMYHPAPDVLGRKLEFIEIFNSGAVPQKLDGFRLTGDVDFTFPSNITIAAAAYLVVAANLADLQSVYGAANAVGNFTNNLPNDRGTVRLRNKSGAVLLEVNYEDSFPWPVAADGSGHSLMLARPSYGEGDARAWSASGTVGGTPGGPETATSDLRTNVLLNEICAHHSDPSQNFIELYNHSATNVDVGGWWLTDDPATNKWRVPDGTVLSVRGFASFSQAQFGFPLDPTGGRVFVFNPARTRVVDAVRYGPQALNISWGRSPDGSDLFSELAIRTSGGTNVGPLARPVVFSELMYHPVSGLDDDQFLELFNRSTNAVNVGGWRLDGGVSYSFAPNTMIAGRGYLVVAKNAARLLMNYPGLSPSLVVGNFSGALSGGGERLALTMPQTLFTTNGALVTSNTSFVVVNELTYNTGGRWGKWSDGGGASLELIDAEADNRLAANWDDSAAVTNAPWTTITYTGPHEYWDGNTAVTALEISLLGAGECAIDDVAVHAAGGNNLVANTNFSTGTGWTFEGNHDLSSITNSGGIDNSGSLYLRAASRGDYLGSRVVTTWSPQISTNVDGTISVKARWIRGWPELLCRLRGGTLEATGPLLLPTDIGTPGRANSRAVTNAGPAIFNVAHSPVLPAGGVPVVVTARVLDPNGVISVSVRYRIDPSATLTTLGMNDSGINGDAIAGDGIYSATIPGQSANTLIAFHVRAIDATGVAATFPNNATARECLVRFGEVQPAGSFGTYRLWITSATASSWANRSSALINNRPLDLTFAYNNFRVIYNAGGAFNGSDNTSELYNTPSGNLCGYTLFFPDDDRFLGASEAILDWPTRDATAQREQMTQWMANEVGLPYNHRRFVRLHVNGVRESQRAALFSGDVLLFEDLQSPGGDYLKEWYPDHDHGDLFKIHVWRRDYKFPARPSPNGESFHGSLNNYLDQSGQKHLARYRWNWRKRATSGSANDYLSLFELVDVGSVANAAQFICDLDTVADTEQWMRIFAFERCVGNYDSWGNRIGQNMYAYKPGSDGRWQLHTFDTDLVLGSTSEGTSDDLFGYYAGIPGGNVGIPDPVIQRMRNTPVYLRAYWRAFRDFVNGPMASASYLAFANAQFAALQSNNVTVSGGTLTGPGGFSGWIDARRAYIQSQLANVNASFTVNPPAGAVTSNLFTLTGTAPIDVKNIFVNGEERAVTWTSVTSWSLTVALVPGLNQLSIVGRDLRGNVFASASNSVSVNFTGGSDTPEQSLVINELMHHPSATNAAFVELFNRSFTTAFDLTGWRLEGLDYTFPEGTVIGPRAFLVVAEDRVAFGRAYGFSIPLVGEFEGSFRTGGETIELVRPVGTNEVVVDAVTYEDALPWPITATVGGHSLQLIDVAQDNDRLMNWSAATATPGAVNFGAIVLPAFPLLWINEVQPTNATGLADNFGERDPWMELYNAGLGAISLTNFYLTDDFTNLTRWGFPAGVVIAPGEFRVVWLDGQEVQTAGTNLHANFRLDPSSGSLALVASINNRTSVVDYLNYSVAAVDLSYGSFPDGAPHTRQWFSHPTPGRTNDSTSPPPPVWINEWMADNTVIISDSTFGGFPDWFELFNSSANTVDLSGWGLSDDPGSPSKFVVPAGVSIAGRGFLLIWADNRGVLTNGELHTNFKLKAGGDEIVVSDPRGTLVDGVAFGQQTNDVSQGRWPNGATPPFYYMTTATPRASNVIPNPPAIYILEVNRSGSGLVSLLWSSTPGVTYRVQFKDQLEDLNWTDLPGDIPATTATTSGVDVLPPELLQRFYRIVALP